MTKLKQLIWGRLYLWFFGPLYKIENTIPSVWRFVNRSGIAFFKAHARKELRPVEARVIRELHESGISLVHIDELLGTGSLEKLLQYAHFETRSGAQNKIKPYITDYFTPLPNVSIENAFAEVALSEPALTIVGNYFGMTPKFGEFSLQEIKAVPEAAGKTHSMRWHRDPNDIKRCKIFIYLNDIGPKNGPFTFLTYSNYGNKYWKLFPHKHPAGIYPPPGEVEKQIDPQDVLPCMGPAGTLVFCDTSGLHYGGFVLEQYRRMCTIGYTAMKSFAVRELTFVRDKASKQMSPLQAESAFGDESLPSRSLYIALKSKLVGKETLGAHITGMRT